MKASRLVRAARKRKGLTQRELAAKTRISQPMISLIERGLQDPRYSTLQRIFRACDLEMDVVNVAGGGIDRTQFMSTLPLTPEERLRRSVVATRAINELVRNARRVRWRGRVRPEADPWRLGTPRRSVRRYRRYRSLATRFHDDYK